jgi:plastocyanin
LIVRPINIVLLALVATAAAVAVAVLALGHDSGPTKANSSAIVAPGKTIDISNFAYSPAAVTVKVGTTIEFTNEESVDHTATSNTEGLFDTGTLGKGQSMRVKMNKVGSFSFHCSFHAFMHGTIDVVA